MKNLPLFASLLLYALSLASPAFLFAKTYPSSGSSDAISDVWNGITILMVGWLGFFYLQFGWYANLLYYLSLGLLWTNRWKLTIAISSIAIVFAANTLLLFQQTLPADEGNVRKLNLQRLEIGFYFWAIALLIPLVWSIVQLRRTA